MEFFNNAKAVRLRSHLGKYLLANDDEETVRQSENGSSYEARWTVEFVPYNCHLIRLKSCYNKYLSASEEPLYLLGLAGKKVVQTTERDCFRVQWEPITSGFEVKLRTRDGKFLRANGGTPPWRNSVTHDVPHRTATQDWVLWGVDVVDILNFDSLSNCESFASGFSYSSSYSEDCGCSDSGSPVVSFAKMSAMEIFEKAKSVRLRSHHDKYLLAEDDEEGVYQDRNGTCKNAKWTVEILENAGVLRLKSCYGKYLSASNMPYFLGVTGKKVVQSLPRRLDSSLEWEPIREGIQVKLKTRYGHYLRANGGMPPWRNSITHDIPHRSSTQDWILWDVDIVEFQKPAPSQEPPPPLPQQHFRAQPPPPPPPHLRAEPPRQEQQQFRAQPPHLRSQTPPQPPKDKFVEQHPSEPTSAAAFYLSSPRNEVENTFRASPVNEGRLIVYNVVDDDGNVDKTKGELSFTFKGSGVEQLKQMVKEVTGLNDIIVCSRNPLNGKPYPLRLHLPPNNATMNLVVVPSTSKLARDLK